MPMERLSLNRARLVAAVVQKGLDAEQLGLLVMAAMIGGADAEKLGRACGMKAGRVETVRLGLIRKGLIDAGGEVDLAGLGVGSGRRVRRAGSGGNSGGNSGGDSGGDLFVKNEEKMSEKRDENAEKNEQKMTQNDPPILCENKALAEVKNAEKHAEKSAKTCAKSGGKNGENGFPPYVPPSPFPCTPIPNPPIIPPSSTKPREAVSGESGKLDEVRRLAASAGVDWRAWEDRCAVATRPAWEKMFRLLGEFPLGKLARAVEGLRIDGGIGQPDAYLASALRARAAKLADRDGDDGPEVPHSAGRLAGERDIWRHRVKRYLEGGLWLESWGGSPDGEGPCGWMVREVPAPVLAEFGLGKAKGAA